MITILVTIFTYESGRPSCNIEKRLSELAHPTILYVLRYYDVIEHFIYADERIHVILSILFNCFISHGYVPSEFMKTAIVPITKNKTGDTANKNNYRPIALVIACSEIFELCILSIFENYICTHARSSVWF